jgi:DNA-binding LacI/PurR family transcriptional regulator
MSKLDDIAKRASVSISTVSNVLNKKSTSIPISPKTKEKVLRIAKELNYKPNLFARSLRTKKSNIIGVVVWDLTDPYFSNVLSGIEHVLEESGYYLVLNNAKAQVDRERMCLEKLDKISAQGALVVGIGYHRETQLFREINQTMNLVLVATKTPEQDIGSVTVDNFKGGFLGAEYLAKQRRARLVYVTTRNMTTDEEDRLAGVLSAVKVNGLDEGFSIAETDDGEAGGYEAAKKVLEKWESPISIFAMDDIMAIGCIRAIKDRKLSIPRDVAVLGFDDLSIANFIEPRLTTIHQPRFELGKKGAEILLESVEAEGERTARNIVLNPRIVIRDSA